VDKEDMVEGIGPKFFGETCTVKHATKRGSDVLVWVFDRAILMRRVGGCGSWGVFVILQELPLFANSPPLSITA
jgi:hypothetical protein